MPSQHLVETAADEPITIEKLYGPLIFADLRVTAHSLTCEWVIERQRINTGSWSEGARLPGQLDDEFDEL